MGAGLRLNFPMVAQGDYFQGEVNYTQGALRYLNQPTQGNYEAEESNSAAYGIMSDCVYGSMAGVPSGCQSTATTSCNLTTAWSVNAAYEHYWTPSVHESFVGAYEAVSYNSQANAILCDSEGTMAAGPGNGNTQWRFRGWIVLCGSRLQQQLVGVGRQLAPAVGRDQVVLSGRRSHVQPLEQRQVGDRHGAGWSRLPACTQPRSLRQDRARLVPWGSAARTWKTPGTSPSVCTRTSCPDRLIEV